jgi:hypothetical protein
MPKLKVSYPKGSNSPSKIDIDFDESKVSLKYLPDVHTDEFIAFADLVKTGNKSHINMYSSDERTHIAYEPDLDMLYISVSSAGFCCSGITEYKCSCSANNLDNISELGILADCINKNKKYA